MIAIKSDGFSFEACHHLEGHPGACANPHGHSYKLSVTIGAPETWDEDWDMVMDFSELKQAVKTLIIDPLDHTDLNESFVGSRLFGTRNCRPTAEIMVAAFADVLEMWLSHKYPYHTVLEVTLNETEHNQAIWRQGSGYRNL